MPALNRGISQRRVRSITDIVSIVQDAGRDFIRDDCLSSGAAIAYYTVFSLPPLLTIILIFANAVGFTEAQAHHLLKQELGIPFADKVAGTPGATPASAPLADNLPMGIGQLGPISTIIGIGLLLLSATAVFGQLQFSLDKAWEVKPDPKQGGLQTFVTKRLLSVGLIVVIGFFLAVSLVLTAFLNEILRRIWGDFSDFEIVGMVLHESVALVFCLLLFATMFKILPDAKIPWNDVWVGAGITAALFEIGKFLIGWYLQNSNIGTLWGTSAVSVIGILVWVYYSSLIVLFGAEITQIWTKRFDGQLQPESGAVRVVTIEHRIEPSTGVEVPH